MSILTVTLNPCIDKTVVANGINLGGLNRVERGQTVIAGKGINVSRVLEKSGVETLSVGFMGRTSEKLNLNSEFVEISAPLRTNLKIFDKESKSITEINEQGFEISEDKLFEFKNLYLEKLLATDVVVLSGSIPKGVHKGIYGELIEDAKKLGVTTVLDSDGESFSLGVKAVPNAVKPNIHELSMYVGEELDTNDKIKSAIKSLTDKGIKLVAVSMGPDGSIFSDGKEFIKAAALSVDVKSTVGAGDSMVAAISYGMSKGLDILEIAKISTAMGSLTCGTEGTEFLSLSYAEAVKNKVKTERT